MTNQRLRHSICYIWYFSELFINDESVTDCQFEKVFVIF